MKFKMAVIIAFIGIFILAGGATSTESDLSKYPGQVGRGFCNGRWWTKMSDTAKTMYLLGLQEGVQLVPKMIGFRNKKAHPKG